MPVGVLLHAVSFSAHGPAHPGEWHGGAGEQQQDSSWPPSLPAPSDPRSGILAAHTLPQLTPHGSKADVGSRPSSFDIYSRVTDRLKAASYFLKDLSGDKGWEYVSSLLRDPAVAKTFGKEYDDLARNAEDARDDLHRCKTLLKAAVSKAEDNEGAEEQNAEPA
mmetsp:Transcript_9284/g.21796  ORF Transcript_9284/g.21796 Transcript_9284/m.21796 type:complete len:164 (-) Transcript_9284:262-753(-)